jgi:D-beta-D-heptose 7-phosphate kinase/D-beta-D-heptose 1-phosphate adenosyltransferase
MSTKNRIVVISGGFDPLHKGHIQYIEAAKELAGPGGELIVGVNSDEWLRRKKGAEFLKAEDRQAIIRALRAVDHCWDFDDSDDTAVELIEQAVFYADGHFDVIFANGGDRSSSAATPESDFCEENGIHCEYGVGGSDKANSSSWILNKWKDRSNCGNSGTYQ